MDICIATVRWHKQQEEISSKDHSIYQDRNGIVIKSRMSIYRSLQIRSFDVFLNKRDTKRYNRIEMAWGRTWLRSTLGIGFYGHQDWIAVGTTISYRCCAIWHGCDHHVNHRAWLTKKPSSARQ